MYICIYIHAHTHTETHPHKVVDIPRKVDIYTLQTSAQYTVRTGSSIIRVYTQLYHTCEHSYMFRLYKCSLHQAGYGNLNRNL